jgi:hypothetical protein
MNNVLYSKISDYIAISFEVLSYGALYIHWLSVMIWSHFFVETWCLMYCIHKIIICILLSWLILYFILMIYSISILLDLWNTEWMHEWIAH